MNNNFSQNNKATSSYQVPTFDFLADNSQQTHSQMEVSIWRAMDQEAITDEEGGGVMGPGGLEQVDDVSLNQVAYFCQQKNSGKPSFYTQASSERDVVGVEEKEGQDVAAGDEDDDSAVTLDEVDFENVQEAQILVKNVNELPKINKY